MNAQTAVTSLFAFLFAITVGCSGGSSGSSAGGANGGGNGGSAAGNGAGAGSAGSTGPCTEFVVGAPADPALGGTPKSKVTAQAVSELAQAAREQVSDVFTSCRNIAMGIGVSPANQATADGQPDARGKADAWCRLAITAMSTAQAKSGGFVDVDSDSTACKLSVHDKAACQGRCNGAAPCDTSANPMTCTAGTLANGFCEDGMLQGGCKVDAVCDASCDARVIANADCPAPAVTVTTTGASNTAEAAKLAATLEAELPMLIALEKKCELESRIVATLMGNVQTVTDIKAACIPPLVAAAGNAGGDVNACLQGAASVVGSIR